MRVSSNRRRGLLLFLLGSLRLKRLHGFAPLRAAEMQRFSRSTERVQRTVLLSSPTSKGPESQPPPLLLPSLSREQRRLLEGGGTLLIVSLILAWGIDATAAAATANEAVGGSGGAADASALLSTWRPLESMAAGAAAGLTRAVSRIFTFPLDTVKTRRQLSRIPEEALRSMPAETRRVIERPFAWDGLFAGFVPFFLQAGPSNAAFFVTYDSFNLLWAVLLPHTNHNVIHLVSSCLATIPSNLIRIPTEVIKQRLQVGQETGGAWAATRSIVAKEGIRGLFVGGSAQLPRELTFNAVQFCVYDFLRDCLKHGGLDGLGIGGLGLFLGGSGNKLWRDALLGAVSSGAAALSTQPIDTVKTRLMTKSVPAHPASAKPRARRRRQAHREAAEDPAAAAESLGALAAVELRGGNGAGKPNAAATTADLSDDCVFGMEVMDGGVAGSSLVPNATFFEAFVNVASAEGVSSLFLGTLPRLALVSTGGAFYFFGQEAIRTLFSVQQQVCAVKEACI